MLFDANEKYVAITYRRLFSLDLEFETVLTTHPSLLSAFAWANDYDMNPTHRSYTLENDINPEYLIVYIQDTWTLVGKFKFPFHCPEIFLIDKGE